MTRIMHVNAFFAVLAVCMTLVRAQSGNLPNRCLQGLHYYPHPYDCTKFFQCANGNPVEKKCWPGTTYNSMHLVCVHASASTIRACSSPGGPPTTTTTTVGKGPGSSRCQNGKNELVPHETMCHRYYNHCSDRGQTRGLGQYEFECNYPDLFDIRRKACVNFNKALCGQGRKPAVWECDYLSYQTGGKDMCRREYPSCRGMSNGPHPQPERNWSPYYVTCKNERSLKGKEKCASHQITNTAQIFHPEKRRCVSLWEVPRQNGGLEIHCARRFPGYIIDDNISNDDYIDNNVHNVAIKCPEGQFYYCSVPLFKSENTDVCKPFSING